MRRIWIAVLLLCSFNISFAQNEIELEAQLAKQYAFQGRTQESITIYQTLLKKGFNHQYYDELLQLFYSVERNRDAENLIKQAIKQNPENKTYSIDLGEHYLKTGEEKQARKTFERIIAEMKANNSEISTVFNLFFAKNNLEYAALACMKGRELLRNPLLFTYELSFIYSLEGKDELIAQEYANLVENNPAMLSQVKIYLGKLFTQKDESKLMDLTKAAVIKRLQAKSDNQSLFSLLVWIFMQENDYKSAFSYAKALDKRLKEGADGIVFEVGLVSLNNNDYQTANEAYQYLIYKGKDNPYYEQSLFGTLTTRYYEFTANVLHSEKDKREIETQYNRVLNEADRNANSAPIMLQFANLLAYHLSKPQEAVDIIDEVQNMPRIKIDIKAEAGLMLADILLMNGDVWAASLEYSKVALEFKNDELGAKAKFAKAKLSYFIGDFQQAEIEFDVLRSSTSKFIANDAMEYSLLLSDNLDEDSTYAGLTLFAKADLALYQHNPQIATKFLDTLNANYTYHSLFDEVLLKRAEIAIEQKQYQIADSLLSNLILRYPYDITADDALFLQAQINETYLQNLQKAMECYERIIVDYSSSLYVTQSRKRYQQIKGSKAEGI